MLKGLLASGITMGVAAVFPETLAFPFFAAVLGVVAGVYPGAAMADPVKGRPTLQWVAAVTFMSLGLFGLWISHVLLVGAWLLHWLWSLVHHLTGLGEGVPEGYPEFCLSYDLVAASFLAYMWWVGV